MNFRKLKDIGYSLGPAAIGAAAGAGWSYLGRMPLWTYPIMIGMGAFLGNEYAKLDRKTGDFENTARALREAVEARYGSTSTVQGDNHEN